MWYIPTNLNIFQEIFPKQKEAEFDTQGRPYQPFFYTLVPDFYSRVFKLRDSMEAVTIFGDRLRSQGKRPDPQQVGFFVDNSQCCGAGWRFGSGSSLHEKEKLWTIFSPFAPRSNIDNRQIKKQKTKYFFCEEDGVLLKIWQKLLKA